MKAGEAWGMLRNAAKGFGADNAVTLAGALAFFTAVSLAPLVILGLWIASFLGPEARQGLLDRTTELMGEQGGQAINTIVENAQNQPGVQSVAGIVGIATLLFGASAVFVQLHRALNIVWNVDTKKGGGVKGMVKKRLLSVAAVLTVVVVLLASLVASSVLATMTGPLSDTLPGGGVALQVLNHGVWLVVFSLLFATMYRYLPDAEVAWKDVWVGAVATAVLFEAGRFGIGIYLGRSAVGSAYGAAGSLIVLLVWVFYSAMIILFGAELTQAWARHKDRGPAGGKSGDRDDTAGKDEESETDRDRLRPAERRRLRKEREAGRPEEPPRGRSEDEGGSDTERRRLRAER